MGDGGDASDAGGPGAAIGDHVVGHVTVFVRELREEGVEVPANAGIDAVRAIDTVGLADRARVNAALRATLVSRHADIDAFERLFPGFWERLVEDVEEPRERTTLEVMEEAARRVEEGSDAVASAGGDGRESDRTVAPGPGEAADDEGTPPEPEGQADAPSGTAAAEEDEFGFAVESSTYSRVGQPERIDVPGLTDADDLCRAVEDLTAAIGNLKGRRWEPSARGSRLAARQALRRSFGSGGTVPDIPMRARRRSAVRAVLLVDVSQSVLDTIDRGFLLRFLRELYDAWRSVRIFFFDTNVRDVTDSFAAPSTAAALSALRQAEAEWGGGTRIGHAVATIREEYPYAIDRETTVFVVSDGLEVDEVDQLRAEMTSMSRRANAVFWLNPLAASPAYEPTCRGMAAALPYVDGLFAFAEAGDIEEMARQLRLRGVGGSIGYRYDQRDRVT